MQDGKFLTLFRSLSPEERSAFDKYLRRLYANETVALNVYDYLRRFSPHFRDDQHLDVEYARRKIFAAALQAESQSRMKLLNALSDLHLWLKEFLLLNKVRQDSFESQALWLTILDEHGLNAQYEKQAASLRKRLDSLPRRSTMDFIKGMAGSHFFYYQRVQDNKSLDIDALLRYGADLEAFHSLARLKLDCEITNLKNTQNWPDQPDARAHDLTGQSAEHPLLLLYRELYQLITVPESGGQTRINALLTEHAHDIDPSELHVIFSYLHNQGAAQIRKGEAAYWQYMHDLNKLGIECQVFTRHGVMSTTQFNNIVNTACKVGDFVWAERFVASKRSLLQTDIAGDTCLLADAIIKFAKADYRSVCDQLSGVNFGDLNNGIRSRALILRSYYELRTDPVDIHDFCVAFETFLKRAGKPKRENIVATKHFVRFVKLLVRGKMDRAALHKELENLHPIYFKDWLADKLDSYKQEFAAHRTQR